MASDFSMRKINYSDSHERMVDTVNENFSKLFGSYRLTGNEKNEVVMIVSQNAVSQDTLNKTVESINEKIDDAVKGVEEKIPTSAEIQEQVDSYLADIGLDKKSIVDSVIPVGSMIVTAAAESIVSTIESVGGTATVYTSETYDWLPVLPDGTASSLVHREA